MATVPCCVTRLKQLRWTFVFLAPALLSWNSHFMLSGAEFARIPISQQRRGYPRRSPAPCTVAVPSAGAGKAFDSVCVDRVIERDYPSLSPLFPTLYRRLPFFSVPIFLVFLHSHFPSPSIPYPFSPLSCLFFRLSFSFAQTASSASPVPINPFAYEPLRNSRGRCSPPGWQIYDRELLLLFWLFSAF